MTAGPAGEGTPVAVTVRTAEPPDYPGIAALTVAAYRAAGFLTGDHGYAAELADVAGRAASCELVVAVTPAGEVVGSAAVVYGPGGPYAELAGPGDAEMRMLAVAPTRQRSGAGEALVRAALDRAVAAGCTRFVLSSRPDMSAAHRLYGRLGFGRTPERDWEPVPGFRLVTFARPLP